MTMGLGKLELSSELSLGHLLPKSFSTTMAASGYKVGMLSSDLH